MPLFAPVLSGRLAFMAEHKMTSHSLRRHGYMDHVNTHTHTCRQADCSFIRSHDKGLAAEIPSIGKHNDLSIQLLTGYFPGSGPRKRKRRRSSSGVGGGWQGKGKNLSCERQPRSVLSLIMRTNRTRTHLRRYLADFILNSFPLST